jgi:parallel beta-helix repeat protein
MTVPKSIMILKVLIILISVLSISVSAYSATYTVTNTDNDGAGSLKQAITDANTNLGIDLITFNIPGSGPHTIQPISALPDITDSVVIDGYTQPGATPATISLPANLLIELDGNNIECTPEPHYCSCLTLHSANSTIRGLVINRCDDAGIHIDNPDGGNIIEGNYIGTDVSGTSDLGNYAHGVRIWDSPYNRIGGTRPAERNILSGNKNIGVEILLTGAVFNHVEGNYIGIDASGTKALGNLGYGVHIKEGAGYNKIGPGNVISGNGNAGICLDGEVETVTRNTIVANFVGTDAFGREGLGNLNGIRLYKSNDNKLKGNIVTSNYGDPISGNGFGANLSNGNIFKDNTATGNGYNGFQLRNSENNILKGNKAIANAYNGFRLGTGSSFNILKDNTAMDNEEDGFSINITSTGNTLKKNTSNNNVGFGYFDESSGNGTSGTDNAYSKNKCEDNTLGGSDPTGLCSP